MKTLKRLLLILLIITSNHIYAQDEVTPCNTGLTSVSAGGGTYASEVSWTISDCDGNLLAEGGVPYEDCLDVPDNAIVNMVDSYGDGWNGNVLIIGDNVFELANGSLGQGFIGTCFCNGEWVEETTTYNCSSFSNQSSCESIDGCSWEFSWGGWGDNGGNGSSYCIGFGTTTNLNCDGELVILGCTHPESVEYNPEANTDDGSCSFENNSDCQNIYITLDNGWNMIGFSCSINTDAVIAFGPIQDKIIIAKDAEGNAYLPSWDFNGIGDLESGYGYLLKVSEEINNYNICE